jgi:DNA-binding response OmpR family regulator
VSGIVVIEEDALLRSLLIEWLTAEGYPVRGSEAGGRRAATTTAPEPQLLIVDVFMPLGRGTERLRSACKEHPGVPVIAISGQFRPGVGSAGAAAEALRVDRVVAKPFAREVMLDAVRSLIGTPR